MDGADGFRKLTEVFVDELELIELGYEKTGVNGMELATCYIYIYIIYLLRLLSLSFNI